MILGIGTDIIRIDRIRRLLGKYPGFVEKVFTSNEIEYCSSKGDPAQSYAVRFAAKEALMKALGTGWDEKVGWLDIEIIRIADGRPEIAVHKRTAELVASMGVVNIHLSLSHEKEYATAMVVLENRKT
jgi:holo-[acyl-carrier protein] synthase